MKLILIACSVLMLAITSAHSQIGWTLEQCKAHWGAESKHRDGEFDIGLGPVRDGYGHRQGMIVRVLFGVNGRVNNIEYTKMNGKPFTEEEIDKLLKSNGPNLVWRMDSKDEYGRSWLGTRSGKTVLKAGQGSNGHGFDQITVDSSTVS